MNIKETYSKQDMYTSKVSLLDLAAYRPRRYSPFESNVIAKREAFLNRAL